MATSKIIQKGSKCIELQGSLKTPVSVGANATVSLLNSKSVSDIFSDIQVGYIPTDKKLVGVVYLFSTSARVTPLDQYVDVANQKVNMIVINLSGTAFTITTLRLLTFWE